MKIAFLLCKIRFRMFITWCETHNQNNHEILIARWWWWYFRILLTSLVCFLKNIFFSQLTSSLWVRIMLAIACHNMKKNRKEKDGEGKRMLFSILVFIYLLQKSLNICMIKVEEIQAWVLLQIKLPIFDRPHQHQNCTARVWEDFYLLFLYFIIIL